MNSANEKVLKTLDEILDEFFQFGEKYSVSFPQIACIFHYLHICFQIPELERKPGILFQDQTIRFIILQRVQATKYPQLRIGKLGVASHPIHAV
jgi:hypothetical protein